MKKLLNLVGWFLMLTTNLFASLHEVEISAEASSTRRPVYKGEYAIVVLVPKESEVFVKANSMADQYGSPPITPHVSIIQGKYHEVIVPYLEKYIKEGASALSSASATLEAKVRGEGENMFWNISSQFASFFNDLTEFFSKTFPAPVTGIMKQVADDLSADQELVKKWGRDFNVPGKNNPHITISYGNQNSALEQKFCEELQVGEPWKFTATSLALAKIDYVGNLYEIVKEVSFTQK